VRDGAETSCEPLRRRGLEGYPLHTNWLSWTHWIFGWTWAGGAPASYQNSRRLLLLLIAAHVIAMLLFATIARLPSAVWDDMLESWAWGKEFQLGYYKHPPLYSWIVALFRAPTFAIICSLPLTLDLDCLEFGVSRGCCSANMLVCRR
jgi:hypothetical protein